MKTNRNTFQLFTLKSVFPRTLIATIGCLALTNCTKRTTGQSAAPQSTAETQAQVFAKADLVPKSGSTARGKVTFAKLNGSLSIQASVSGVPRTGLHGIHIHEFGNCSAPDASSAGDHLNPTDQPHGAPNTIAAHVGDLGNIEVMPDGTGTLSLVLQDAYYAQDRIGGWDAIIGKAVILHKDQDDFESQPSGDAGDRIACGVIEAEATNRAADSKTT